MNDEKLFEAIRSIGHVAPPPDRAGALTRALAATPARRRARRFVVAIVAAAVVAVPVGVLAAHQVRSTHAPKPPVKHGVHTSRPSSVPSSPAVEQSGATGEQHQSEPPESHGDATQRDNGTPSPEMSDGANDSTGSPDRSGGGDSSPSPSDGSQPALRGGTPSSGD